MASLHSPCSGWPQRNYYVSFPSCLWSRGTSPEPPQYLPLPLSKGYWCPPREREMEAEERSSLPPTGVKSVAEGHRAQRWRMCSQAAAASGCVPKAFPALEQNTLRVLRTHVRHSLVLSPPSTSQLSQPGLSGPHGMRIHPSFRDSAS